jgi:agmatinase
MKLLNVFHNLFTFLKIKKKMFAHAQAKDRKRARWIIFGIPQELGSLSKVKNYSEGPEAIREASYRIFDTIFRDIDPELIYDFGDLELEDVKSLEESYNVIEAEIKKIYDPKKKFVFLGGDHSITYSILKVIKEFHDEFNLLFFDAHPDCHPDPYVNYQSFVLYLIKEGVIAPEKTIMVGVSNLSFDEKRILKEYGIRYYTPFEIWEDPEKVSNEICNALEGKKVYISIDIDVFDCGCGHWLEPFGIRPYHYFKLIKNLNIDLIGFDLVELYPNEFCENLAAKLIVETIAIFDKQN